MQAQGLTVLNRDEDTPMPMPMNDDTLLKDEVNDKAAIDTELNAASKCPFSLRNSGDKENIESNENNGVENEIEMSDSVKEEMKDGDNSNNNDNEEASNDKKDNLNSDNANNSNTNTDNATSGPRVLFEDIPLNRQPVILPGGIIMPSPIVESVNTSWKTQQLTPELINDYCKALFKFKIVNFMHFK